MPRYVVSGAFAARRAYWQNFRKTCEAKNEAAAREWAFSQIGGCHRVKRHEIRLDSVTEASA